MNLIRRGALTAAHSCMDFLPTLVKVISVSES